MIRIFHTSDVHIGLKFTRGYPPALQQKLADARLETLSSMVHAANAERCDLFIVAGDLFDNTRVSKARIRSTAQALREFSGLVVVMPGNHDFIREADDPVWPTFADALGEGHLILEKCQPYDLSDFNLNAVLLPGVCTSRHSSQNAIQWIKDVARTEEVAGKLLIGVAHGSLEGRSVDFHGDYCPMTRKELDESGVHLWLLGHTHVRFPEKESGEGDTVFFPSVPEPDGFDCGHDGYAWVIELAEDGNTRFRSLATGRFRFRHVEKQLANASDVERLKQEFKELSSSRDLVKLTLTGRLPGDLYDDLGTLLDELENNVLYLERKATGVLREIRSADIDREFTEGSFPHRLLKELTQSDDDLLALQIAYELVEEAKSC